MTGYGFAMLVIAAFGYLISQSAIFHLARRKGITPHEAINTLRAKYK